MSRTYKPTAYSTKYAYNGFFVLFLVVFVLFCFFWLHNDFILSLFFRVVSLALQQSNLPNANEATWRIWVNYLTWSTTMSTTTAKQSTKPFYFLGYVVNYLSFIRGQGKYQITDDTVKVWSDNSGYESHLYNYSKEKHKAIYIYWDMLSLIYILYLWTVDIKSMMIYM